MMIKASGIINKKRQSDLLGLGYWPERFFELNGTVFAYYLDNTKGELKGLYRLGKDDTVEYQDGILTLTSTFYKDFDTYSGGVEQKLKMKFGDATNKLEFWQQALTTTIEYINTLQVFKAKCRCGSVEWSLYGHGLVEATCHCVDCAFYQGTLPSIMFSEGTILVNEGDDFLDVVKSVNPNSTTLRAYCKNCRVYCFGDFRMFHAIGVPINRFVDNGELPADRLKYHINYGSRHTPVHDDQLKYFDLPSGFGGSGNVVDDDGKLIGQDTILAAKGNGSSAALMDSGHGQVALVTGANRGIGFEIANQLAKFGFHVVVSGRDQGKVEKAVADLNAKGFNKVEALVMDAMSDESVEAAVKTFSTKHNKLDALINNVGGGYDYAATASTISLDEAQNTMQMNLFSAWRVTQAFAPLLKAASPGARIVMVGSGAGAIKDEESGFGFTSIGNGTVAANGVSKMAVNGLTVKLSLEFKDDGIMVNSTCPGYTDSAGTGNGGRPVEAGAASIAWAAKLSPGGPTGGFFRDGKPLNF